MNLEYYLEDQILAFNRALSSNSPIGILDAYAWKHVYLNLRDQHEKELKESARPSPEGQDQDSRQEARLPDQPDLGTPPASERLQALQEPLEGLPST